MATTTSDEVSLSARGRVNGDPKSGAPSSEIGDDLNAVTPWAIESDPTATVGSSVFSGPHAKLTLEDAGMAQAVQPAAGSCAAQERLDSTSSSERMMVVLDTTPPAIRNANQSAGTVDWRSALRAELALGGGLERLAEAEKQMIADGLQFKAMFDNEARVRPLQWSLPDALCHIAYISNDPNPWCKCVATIHAAAKVVLEGIWEIESPHLRYSAEVAFKLVDRPSVHSVDWLVQIRSGLLKPLECHVCSTWVDMTSHYAIAFLSPSIVADDAKLVMRSSQLVTLYPQTADTTELTYIFQLNFQEVPASFLRVNALRRHREIVASIQRHHQDQMRILEWSNNLQFDDQRRGELTTQYLASVHEYTEEEDAIIARGSAMLGAFARSGVKLKHRKCIATLDRMTMIHTQTGLLGTVQGFIRTSPENVLAFLMDVQGKEFQASTDRALYVRYELRDVVHECYSVCFVRLTAAPFTDRTFLNALVWKKVCDEPRTYIWVTAPIGSHHSILPEDEEKAIRAEACRCIRLTAVDNRTKMEYVGCLDLKGRFPAIFTNTVIMPQMIGTVAYVQAYFQRLRPMGACTAEDGEIVGHMLIDEARNNPKFLFQTDMLRNAPLNHMRTILKMIVNNTATAHIVGEIPATSDPSLLSLEGAALIGESVNSVVLTHVNPVKATDELFSKFAVLRTVEQDCEWFRPMVETLVFRLLVESKGLKMRFLWSAILSLLDVSSDVVTMVFYWLSGQLETALAILAMLSLSVAMQILVVFFRNRHRSRYEIAIEVLIVLSFFKPVIDLRRLSSRHDFDGVPFDISTERTMCRIIESVCESVPASILQIITMLILGRWPAAVLVSISLSWIATAYKCAMITCEIDTNPRSRAYNPLFYGFIPNGGKKRSAVPVFLFLVLFANVVGKTVALSLLYCIQPRWPLIYTIADMCCYLIYKAARRDFLCWFPGSGLFSSLAYRIVGKLMADFSALPHLRNPCELGGTFLILVLVLNQFACLGSGWLYTMYYSGHDKIESAQLFALLGALVALWSFGLVGFVLTIKPEYLRTFTSFETSSAYCVRRFHESQANDHVRVEIFSYSERLWLSIRPEVKAWVRGNFARWKLENPKWFTDTFIDRLPDEFLPIADTSMQVTQLENEVESPN